MTDLEQLAERVEALSGPDRKVDAEIDRTLGHNIAFHHEERIPFRETGWAGLVAVPRYTSALDEAVTLVPENHEWSVGWAGNSDAVVRLLPDGPEWRGYAATPALALCAAALRARSVK